VDSACVSLARRNPELLTREKRQVFVRLVKQSFSQRRKMMIKLLKSEWPENNLEGAFEQAQLPLQARAEDASLDQFVCLAQILSKHE